MKNTYLIIFTTMVFVALGGISSIEAGDKDNAASLVQNACKDKIPGDTVKVAGKDMKCQKASAATQKANKRSVGGPAKSGDDDDTSDLDVERLRNHAR